MHLAVARQLFEARPQLAKWDVHGSRAALYGKFEWFANVKNECVFDGIPMADRHVTPQHVGGHHPGEIDRILSASELWRVAELGFL